MHITIIILTILSFLKKTCNNTIDLINNRLKRLYILSIGMKENLHMCGVEVKRRTLVKLIMFHSCTCTINAFFSICANKEVYYIICDLDVTGSPTARHKTYTLCAVGQ